MRLIAKLGQKASGQNTITQNENARANPGIELKSSD
jgi:hypothetical protein